jgi:hypothetical protein
VPPPADAFGRADADLGGGRSVERGLTGFRAEAVLHAGALTGVAVLGGRRPRQRRLQVHALP